MQADIFDTPRLLQRREAAAADFTAVDYLKRDATALLADRLCDLTQRFPLVLDVGCHTGQLKEMLTADAGVEQVIACDSSANMLRQTHGMRVQIPPERLPFAEASFDAVVSAASLHHTNDLVGMLTQMRRLLKPDGIMLCVMPGPESFYELRNSFAAVEARYGEMRPHFSPFPEIRDAGNLLQRCGYALPVADQTLTHIEYGDPLTLMRELKQMGEANALISRDRRFYPKRWLQEVCAHYREHYATPEGRVQATVEWITLTARAPDARVQQQPAKRGSGNVDLKQFLH